MSTKPSITFVGAGSLVLALAPALHHAGYRIDELVVRDRPTSRRHASALGRRIGARVVTWDGARLASDDCRLSDIGQTWR